jgi:signal transduction histidine kinase
VAIFSPDAAICCPPQAGSTRTLALRLSLRNQILIPLIAIQGVTLCAVTAATAALTARRSEHQLIERLNGVVETLGHANFPYTASVLTKMRGLSGAEFVAYAADGRVTESSFSGLKDTLPPLPSIPRTARLDSLGQAPTVRLDGVRYFAVPLRPTGSTHGSPLLVLYPETNWRQARREAATPPLLLGGGSLLLAAGVTSWIAHRISRRIGTVNRQVARIAGGDFEGFDPGREGDEITDLVRSINSMCLQLRDLSRTIQQSERTRLLAQLAAGLAHQMRNSLTGARMSVQLHTRRCPASSGDRSLEVALRQLAMTEEQVKGLLSLGRVEERPPTECDLGRLLGDIALLVGPACEHAKVTLEVRGDGESLAVLAEEPGLRAAALNLALNAVEAAGCGGMVRLEAIRDGEAVAIQVSDSGPGPPPGLAESLFEPFATSKPEGVGLGLAIAQQVAARHGGSLTWARETRETRFRLSLPRIREAAKEAV